MNIVIRLFTICWNAIYACLKCLPVKKRVVMMSRQSDTPSYEFQMIAEELFSIAPNIQVKYMCKTMGRSVDSNTITICIQAVGYLFHMFYQTYYLATSSVVLLDSYCPSVSMLHHRKSLQVVQMWHSMGTMKLFGWAILGQEEGSSVKMAKAMHMHENYDYYFASSPAYQSHLAKGFHCSEEKARIFPLPRYDLLKSKSYAQQKREEIYKHYPQLINQKVIVYCPTFRKDESLMEKALLQLCENVPIGFTMVIKLHPFSKLHVTLPTQERVINDQVFSTMDMFFVADYVISDYSCVIYEAALLQIPLCFYHFDFGTYVKNRGFAIDYEHELPGVISKDAKTIMQAIQHHDFHEEELIRFTKKYIVDTNHATKDIAQFLVSLCEEETSC